MKTRVQKNQTKSIIAKVEISEDLDMHEKVYVLPLMGRKLALPSSLRPLKSVRRKCYRPKVVMPKNSNPQADL